MFLASSAAQKPNLPMEKEVLRLSSGVRVERHGQSYAASSLVLTPYHISVYDDQESIIVKLAISTLKTVDKKFKTVDTHETPIYLQTSTFFFCKLYIRHEVDADTLYSAIVNSVNIEAVMELYAFRYPLLLAAAKDELIESQRQIYDVELEFTRQGLTPAWRVSQINSNYAYCGSYPRVLVVPEKISDAVLKHIGNFRSKSRIPVLSYVHCSNGTSITRSSQPMAIFSTSGSGKGLIIDARPTANAMGQMALGAGTENTDVYKFGDLHFAGIDNIHVVRESMNRLIEALQLGPLPISKSSLDKSGWLKHIRNIIKGAILITKSLLNGTNVLVHCSDGWDRTSQLCSLAEICLDPYYRTVEGFMVLVEKEWCSFGSQIVVATSPSLPETLLERVALLRAVLEMLLLCLRLNKEEKRWGSFFLRGSRVSGNRQVYILLIRKSREAFASSNSDLPSSHKTSEKTRVNLLAPKEVSPIFTQFLDSVYQIWIQYPSMFEFNEKFLIAINNAAYSSQFGTFLFNCERERLQFRDDSDRNLSQSTVSLWDSILRERHLYENPVYKVGNFGVSTSSEDVSVGLDTESTRGIFYEEDRAILLPSISHLQYWSGLITGSEAKEVADTSILVDQGMGREEEIMGKLNELSFDLEDDVVAMQNINQSL
ncbi:MAG: hypothetical protein SGCHY_001199 [Lobulomycetales sp.]